MAGGGKQPFSAKIIVLVIILVLLVIPMYFGLVGIIFWVYGKDTAHAALKDSAYLYSVLKYLFEYWRVNHDNRKFPLIFPSIFLHRPHWRFFSA